MSDAGCWQGHFTAAFCCAPLPGIWLESGNPECWDDVWTYGRCCPKLRREVRHRWMHHPSAGGWPPEGLLSLLGPAGPLVHQAATNGVTALEGDEQPSPWFQTHIPLEYGYTALDSYSKGGSCTMEMRSRALEEMGLCRHAPDVRWLLLGSSCKPYLNCPLWVPVAFFVVDRVASLSTLIWLAQLDGRPRRRNSSEHFVFHSLDPGDRVWFPEPFEPAAEDKASLHSIWDSMARAYAGDNVDRLVRQWLYPEFAAVGVSRQHARNLTERFLSRYFSGFGEMSLGRRLMLPKHLCPTCCQHGIGRLRVMLVRNPFERLVSFFRLRWLGSVDKRSNRWEDFATYVRYVSQVFNQTDAYRSLPTEFSHGALLPNNRHEFEQEDLLHTRAVTEWLASAQPPLNASDFFHIKVEELGRGMLELSRRLCLRLNYCLPLPEMPKVNSFSKAIPARVWANCWRGGAALQAYHRYRTDFQELGYSPYSWNAPSARKGRRSSVKERGLRIAVREVFGTEVYPQWLIPQGLVSQ